MKLRNKLIKELLKIPGSSLNGHPEKRLPNNINISFESVDNEAALLYLNEFNIYASIGSACSNNEIKQSHVIDAIKKPGNNIRFSLGIDTKEEDIDYVIEVMPKIINNLRQLNLEVIKKWTQN